MINFVHVLVQAGDGGLGCESYQARTDRKIVPTGGDGGRGGHVIFKASNQAPKIEKLKLRQHIVAESGAHGGSNNKKGRKGKDEIILVPPGTRIYNRATRMSIRDLKNDGDEVMVARGGAGGFGNEGGRKQTSGGKGDRLEVELEYFLVSDVFLVGLPNSGKSQFMGAITNAHVPVTDYPFSTRYPAVGAYEYDGYKQMFICEMMSVSETSREGHGLGVEFLRQLVRAKVIVLFLDATTEFAESVKVGLQNLEGILKDYAPEEARYEVCAVVNKIDACEDLKKLKKDLSKVKMPVFYISAKEKEGFDPLLEFLTKTCEARAHESIIS